MTQQLRKNKVFLVDDHPIVRQGLTLLIDQERDLTVCGEAEEMHLRLAIYRAAPSRISLCSTSPLNGPDGLDLLENTCDPGIPKLPVLMLSMHDESIYAERTLRAGANGYIMKQEATEKVLIALRRILSNEIYVSDRIANNMLRHYVRGAPRRAKLAGHGAK